MAVNHYVGIHREYTAADVQHPEGSIDVLDGTNRCGCAQAAARSTIFTNAGAGAQKLG
jgi:hypothetical protein